MIVQDFLFEIQTVEWITMITLKNNGDLFGGGGGGAYLMVTLK